MATGIPEYDELKLRVDPLGGHAKTYRVIASAPGGGTATGEFRRPISKLELENFILRAASPRSGVRGHRSSPVEEAKRFGGALFEGLLTGDVGEIYHGARGVANSKGRGLRITLSMTGAPELLELPWELLYDRGEASFLATSIYTPVVRSLDLKNPPAAPELTLPLQVLAFVSSPERFPPLDTEAEREKLEAALRPLIDSEAVRLEWLESATLSELDRRIAARDELHVIHYIGHGAYDERTQGGVLVLEDAHGGPHEVSGEDFGSYLRDERSLRLVVLNSCEGSRTSHVDPFSGVASSLLRCGLPAVIGMQVEITDQAAITFSDRLYTALAQGFPVDAALAQARRAISAAGHEVEFGTPVLFMRVSDGRIFNVTEALPAPPPPQPGRLELELRAEPDTVWAGETATWKLRITNAGGSTLADVTARDRTGEARAGPLPLEPGATHECSWPEAVERDVEESVSVTARGPDGRTQDERVRASVSVTRLGWWERLRRSPKLMFGGATAALLALVFALVLATGILDGDDSADFDVFTVGADVQDIDARGDKIAIETPVAGADGSVVQRLDPASGQLEQAAPEAPNYNGVDVGLNSAGHAQLVYSRCDEAGACDLFRRQFRGGPEQLLPPSDPQCSEIRPSMSDGHLLFARSERGCAPELLLKPAGGAPPVRVAGPTQGADMNVGTVVWLAPDGALHASEAEAGGRLSSAGRLEPPGGERFRAPLVVEDGFAYFVHRRSSQNFIARTRLPLGESGIDHYSEGVAGAGAEESPHFAVTDDTLYTTNYPRPDGGPGSRVVVRVPDPSFSSAD